MVSYNFRIWKDTCFNADKNSWTSCFELLQSTFETSIFKFLEENGYEYNKNLKLEIKNEDILKFQTELTATKENKKEKLHFQAVRKVEFNKDENGIVKEEWVYKLELI